MKHTLAIEVLKAAAEEHRKSHDGWIDHVEFANTDEYRERAEKAAQGRARRRDELLAAVKVLEEDAKIETVIDIPQTEKPPNRNCPECGKQYFIDWRNYGWMGSMVMCKTPGCSKGAYPTK